MSKKISEMLPLAPNGITGNEEIPVALGGNNSKIKLSDLRKTVSANDITDLSSAVAAINANLNLNVSLQNSEW